LAGGVDGLQPPQRSIAANIPREHDADAGALSVAAQDEEHAVAVRCGQGTKPTLRICVNDLSGGFKASAVCSDALYAELVLRHGCEAARRRAQRQQ
jgi:hypothetical protein